MTNLDGTTTECCGCVLNADGKCVTPCPSCLKAALAERTHGLQVKAECDAIVQRITKTYFDQLAERVRRTREWLSSL